MSSGHDQSEGGGVGVYERIKAVLELPSRNAVLVISDGFDLMH